MPENYISTADDERRIEGKMPDAEIDEALEETSRPVTRRRGRWG